MHQPELRMQGTVTTATATAITFTPSGVRDAQTGATVTTIVLNGTGLSRFAVGDRIRIRING